ncbi:PTS sugar transporter subunit IIA [Domibacillus tundrae]|uniref:PTS sugar transporter subunit IIA n=1 Tax=Domibacillus tundrae TaxID=1587527 RepID=UPI00339687B0
MPLAQFLKDELIKLDVSCDSRYDVFDLMYEEAFKRGYVSESFLPKIKEREEMFPTGLNLDKYSIAIPHTDPECVFEQFIGVITLKEPVLFQLMDDKSKEVEVKVILMLGLNEPHSQLAILQKIMQIVQDEETYEKISAAKNCKEIHQLFNKLETA